MIISITYLRFTPVLLVVLMGSIQLIAQQSDTPCENKRAIKFFRQGRSAEGVGNIDAAIDLYQKSLQKCPNWQKASQKLGHLYLLRKQYNKTIEVLESVCSSSTATRGLMCIDLARAKMALMRYDEAIEHLEKYLNSDHSNPYVRKEANKLMADAQFSTNALSDSMVIDFKRLPPSVNSTHSEYLPSLTADEETLFFTRRTNNYESIYYANGSISNWSEAVEWSVPNARFRKASSSISPDGRLLLFAMADHPSGFGNFDLYYSVNVNGRWSDARNLGRTVNTSGWESQPSIGPDGRTVYFTTDRRGGNGGRDIWRTYLTDQGIWTKPVNLGPAVNSIYDEESPFIHRDGQTLFFRSNGHPGFGSFDVFMSRKHTDAWTIPVNLGYPINTPGSEGGLYVTMDGANSIYGSDLQGGSRRQIDLFTFEMPDAFRPRAAGFFHLNVFDCQLQRGTSAKYEIFNPQNNTIISRGETNPQGYAFFCLPKDQNLGLIVEKEDFTYYSDYFELTGLDQNRNGFYIDIEICPVEEEVAQRNPIVMRNVQFETASAELLPSSDIELDRLSALLKRHEDIRIEIQGHTDDEGTVEYNKDLSLRRARSVYEYLTGTGIDPDRLSFTGYGEERPIASNETAEGRRLNRRTSFKIMNQ